MSAVSMQATLGIILTLLGTLAFFDRERPVQERHLYYPWDPKFGTTGRTVSAVLIVVVGQLVLWTS